jgi:hypothetical protein
MSDETTKPTTEAAPSAAPAAKQTTLFAQQAPGAGHAPAPTISAQVIEEIAAARKQAADEANARKALEAQLEELKATVAKANEQVGLSAKQTAELAAQRSAERKRAALEMAAVKHGAVSESQLVKLLADDVDEADGKVFVRGKPELDADALVAGFLKANPHMAKARVAQGSGATPFPGGAPAGAGAAPQFDLKTDEGLTQYARWLTYPPGKAPAAKPGA